MFNIFSEIPGLRFKPFSNLLRGSAFACTFTLIFALPEFLALIPNGVHGDDPTAGIGCLYIGHTPCSPGADRNQFGLDFDAAGRQWTKDLCQMDSDGDGVSNGQELGDPCCQWSPGNDHVLRTSQLSHPGVKDNITDAAIPSCAPTPSSSQPISSFTATMTPNTLPSSSSSPNPSVSASPSSVPTITASSSLVPSSLSPSSSSGSETTPTSSQSTMATSPSMQATVEATPTEETSSATEATSEGESVDPTSPEVQITFPIVTTESDEESVCFPALSKVNLLGGVQKSMYALQVGDVVQVANNKYSEVFMFTHRLSEIIRPFVILETAHANVSLTASHFLYINDRLLPAESALPGDFLQLQDGSKDVIKYVRTKRLRGLYNPQTMHGDIIVDGVRASTYTKVIAPSTAHPLLAPLRLLFRFTGWSTSVLNSGAGRFAQWIS